MEGMFVCLLVVVVSCLFTFVVALSLFLFHMDQLEPRTLCKLWSWDKVLQPSPVSSAAIHHPGIVESSDRPHHLQRWSQCSAFINCALCKTAAWLQLDCIPQHVYAQICFFSLIPSHTTSKAHSPRTFMFLNHQINCSTKAFFRQ